MTDDFQPMLMRAITIAIQAHAVQVDKQGKPYILHVMRVATSPRLLNIRDQIVAALHDVVEDSDITLEELRPYFPPYEMDAVDCLTRRGGEAYDVYIARLLRNSRAALVKLADLDDNISRLQKLNHEDRARLGPRYIKARDHIEIALQLHASPLFST